MIIHRKYFSGSAETPINGVSYYSGQVLDKYLVDPVDKTIVKLEETPVIGETRVVKRKVRRIRGILNPLKQIINRQTNNK